MIFHPCLWAQDDRNALIALYESTDGDNWSDNSGWKAEPTEVDGFNDDPCVEPFWFGVSCEDGRVVVLEFFANQLSGPIPPELGDLASLTTLLVGGSQLSGSIPSELGQLVSLRSLDLAGNQLSGAIPPQLGQLANLGDLNLGSNQLSGSIPPELGDLANLTVLALFANQLSGPVPPQLGQLANLTSLDLAGNQLTASIPTELLQLANLTFLSLSGNRLTGPIPPEVGQLASLTALTLSSNQLSGSIPPEFAQLSNLTRVFISGNQLSGAIPPELGQLTDLEFLDLASNQLTGCIPVELGQFASLDQDGLDLRFNSLYTDSNVLRAFLNSKQFGGDWESFQALNLYFAQFADGSGLSSQITLLNLNDESAASASIEILDQQGQPLDEPLSGLPDGQDLNDFSVPASGVLNLRSDGEGDVQVGSVRVTSDRHLVGVVTFGGTQGLAGVGASELFQEGLRAPVRSSSAAGLKTGLALTDLSGGQNTLTLELLDGDGQVVAQAVPDPLAASGQTALFADEVDWDSEFDFSDFNGSLAVTGSGALTGTVLETVPGEFITLPVSELAASQNGQAVMLGQTLAPRGDAPAQHVLNFAQFADGAGLSSALVLVNLDGENQAAATILLNDAGGQPLTADLDGEAVEGQTEIVIAAGGMRVLASDGQGDLAQGSAQVVSDRPLAGVIVFTGPGLGSAGVGAGEELPEGFQAPMESDTLLGINTGVALMNLESEDNVLQVQLFDAQGALAAETEITLPALGREALFVNQFDWDQEVDFGAFEGSLRVRTSGRLAATVIQTRPGQFATQPVAFKPAQ